MGKSAHATRSASGRSGRRPSVRSGAPAAGFAAAVPLAEHDGGGDAASAALPAQPAGPLQAPQAKLRVSEPGDRYEQEADRIADAVLRMPQTGPERPISGGAAMVQRREAGESGRPAGLDPGTLGGLRGGGAALNAESRAFFEPRFGHDFSRIRVHTDSRADGLARGMNARAFTVGPHIAFASGQYRPEEATGRRLLAHELVHTVQQEAAPRIPRPSAGTPEIGRGPLRVQRGVVDWLKEKATGAVKAVGGAVKKGLKAAGDFIASLLNKVLRHVPGYSLVRGILGKDPVSEKSSKPSGGSLIRMLFKLFGREDLYQRLVKAQGALAKAARYFFSEVGRLGITWDLIRSLISRAWDAVSIRYGFARNLKIVADIFAPTVRKLIAFGKRVGRKVFFYVFEALLTALGAPVKRVMGILNKGAQVIFTIVRHPIRFFGNVVAALKQGFSQFGRNIWAHLKRAVVDWLFGNLSQAGIQLPERFDLKGVFTLVAQILGLTWDNIRPKIVRVIGEPAMRALETSWAYVKVLVTGGPGALWERIKKDLGSLKDMVLGAIKQWVVTRIVTAAIEKLATMWNPVGAIYQAIKGIYNTVMFFIERARQIAAMVQAVFASIARIAAGQIKPAADWVEKAMARTLPVILGFLARLIGLGGISAKIREVIQKLRRPVDRALDKVIGFVAKKARAFLARGKSALKRGAAKVKALLFPKRPIRVAGKTHTVAVDQAGTSPRIVVRSRSRTMRQYLAELETQYGSVINDASAFSEAKQLLQAAEDLIQKLSARRKVGDEKGATREENRSLKAYSRFIHHLNTRIIDKIGDRTRAESKDMPPKRLLLAEGRVAAYKSLPSSGGVFDRDHQPQKSLLFKSILTSMFRRVDGSGFVNKPAERIYQDGPEQKEWPTMFIYGRRHQLTRTYGVSAPPELASVKSIKRKYAGLPRDQKATKQGSFIDGVVTILKSALGLDHARSKKIYSDTNLKYTNGRKNFSEIAVRPKLRRQVMRLGSAGADKLRSAAEQRLDELKQVSP